MIKIKVAGFVFAINVTHPYTELLCEDYITDEPSDELITITEEDIEYERSLSIRGAEYREQPSPNYTDGYLEGLAVYRRIIEYVSHRDGCGFHGALIERNGAGYLFTAKSGTGKTTHIMNWMKQYPDTIVINGDKPILRLVGDSIIGYGTPWSGKEHLNSNRAVKLKAIISLNRAEENSIERIDSKQFLQVFVQQIFTPQDPGGLKRTLLMVSNLVNHTELYRLGCNMKQSSAVVSYEGMNSQNMTKEEI